MGLFKEFYLVRESPDRINDQVWWKKQDARCFGQINNKFFVSTKPTIHSDFLISLLNNNKISLSDLSKHSQETMEVTREDFQYPGRIWVSEHIISFWNKINKSELLKVMKELNKNGIPINDSWKIEVEEGKTIPIKDFENKDSSFKNVDHLLSPSAKNKVMKHKGVKAGSEVMASKVPKGYNSVAQYNSMRTTSESLDESFEHDFQKQKELEDKSKTTGDILNKFPKGPMGLTPDHITNTQEWKTAKRNSDIAFQNLRNFNEYFVKKYKKELKAIRDKRNAERESKYKVNEDGTPTTVAPSSISNGQFQSKLGSVAKRTEPKLINDIKNKVKKKLKKKSKKEKPKSES